MKYLFLALIVFLFFSCGQPVFYDIMENELPDQDIDISFDNFDAAWKWVDNNIKYKEEKVQYKQTPEETYKLRTGDCEDFALLLAYFAYQLNPDDILVVGTKKKNNVDHMICRYKGELIEPQTYKRVYSPSDFKKIYWEVSYPEMYFNSILIAY